MALITLMLLFTIGKVRVCTVWFHLLYLMSAWHEKGKNVAVKYFSRCRYHPIMFLRVCGHMVYSISNGSSFHVFRKTFSFVSTQLFIKNIKWWLSMGYKVAVDDHFVYKVCYFLSYENVLFLKNLWRSCYTSNRSFIHSSLSHPWIKHWT